MYGGRAIDSFDRRILTIYMDEYLGDFIFDTFQPFHFFHNDDVDYRIPEGTSKDDFVGERRSIWYLGFQASHRSVPFSLLALCRYSLGIPSLRAKVFQNPGEIPHLTSGDGSVHKITLSCV